MSAPRCQACRRALESFACIAENLKLCFASAWTLAARRLKALFWRPKGKEFFRKRVETQQEKGCAHILNRIKGLYDELAAGIHEKPALELRHFSTGNQIELQQRLPVAIMLTP